jgi:hypothetical protein
MSAPGPATTDAEVAANRSPEAPASLNSDAPESNIDIFEPFSHYLPSGALLSLISLPFQALAIFVLSRLVQEVVLCIDEVYEATGRRARSKFATIPWIRIACGVLVLAMYHFGLFRLAVKSYRALRARPEAD